MVTFAAELTKAYIDQVTTATIFHIVDVITDKYHTLQFLASLALKIYQKARNHIKAMKLHRDNFFLLVAFNGQFS